MTSNYDISVVGSGGVGKSCITIRFLKDEFNESYDPTIGISINLKKEENYKKSLMIDGKQTELSVTDTAGQQNYKALRDQHLRDAQGFILVFALNDLSAFEEAIKLREQILRIKQAKVPLVLCGNKCDIDPSDFKVKDSDIEYLIKDGVTFYRTSAKADINITEAFEELIRQCRAFYKEKEPEKKKKFSFKKLFKKRSDKLSH